MREACQAPLPQTRLGVRRPITIWIYWHLFDLLQDVGVQLSVLPLQRVTQIPAAMLVRRERGKIVLRNKNYY